MKIKIVRYTWIIIGLIFFAIGTIGAFLPILPTFPFYIVTLFCFARSSEKLHTWFVGTKLYKNNIEKIANRKGTSTKTESKDYNIFHLDNGNWILFYEKYKNWKNNFGNSLVLSCHIFCLWD